VTATDLYESALVVIGRQDGWSRNVFSAALDVRDPEAWESVWARAEAANGPVDRLINNAGFLAPDWAKEFAAADVHTHFDVNVKGVVFGTQKALRMMTGRGSGHIINIGSLAGLSPVPGLSLYAGSKFAVRGFSLSVAAELQGTGVTLTLLEPDAIATPMLDLQSSRPEAELTFSGGRVLSPADIEVALDEAFAKRPLELIVPTGRGILARAAGLMPGLGMKVVPLLRRLGRRGQAAFRG